MPLGLPHIYLILGMQPHQGVRERARVPQLVMLCRRWAHLQCFAGRTGRMALMEQLQAIVLLENAHNTATSGLLKKI